MQTLFESTCAQSVLLYVPLPQNGCSKDDLTVLDMLAAGMSEGEAINDFFLDKMNANFECSQQSKSCINLRMDCDTQYQVAKMAQTCLD